MWFAGVHTDIGGGYPDHALGDIPGEWMAREAQACGLGLEPHFLLRLNPDYAGRQHNEYKGFYKAMGRKHVRAVEPVVHESVRLSDLLDRLLAMRWPRGWQRVDHGGPLFCHRATTV